MEALILTLTLILTLNLYSPNPNPNPKQVAERKILPVCGADDKKNIMALINGGKEHDIDFSSHNMVDINRSAPRRLKASLEDILEQAGMLEEGKLEAGKLEA